MVDLASNSVVWWFKHIIHPNLDVLMVDRNINIFCRCANFLLYTGNLRCVLPKGKEICPLYVSHKFVSWLGMAVMACSHLCSV